MVEDGEVVFEGSALHQYLVQCNYDDGNSEKAIDFEKRTNEKSMNDLATYKWMERNLKSDSYRSQNYFVECIFKTCLMFEDDVLIVRTILSGLNSNIIEKRESKYHLVRLVATMSVSSAICHIICCKLKLPVFTTIVILSPLVLSYSVKQLSNSLNIIKIKIVFSKFLEIMKRFSLLMVKTLKFIKESELRRLEDPLQKKTLNLLSALKRLEINDSVDDRESDKSYSMYDLRYDMLHCSTKMIVTVKCAVFKVIQSFPLDDCIDRKCLYISRLSNEELGIEDNIMLDETTHFIPITLLQKMKYLYLLMQSELLRRICISLMFFKVEKLQKDLLSIMMDVKDECYSSYERLYNKYRMHYYCYRDEKKKKYDDEGVNNNMETKNSKTANWQLHDISIHMHSLSNHLRWMLTQSSEIEELIQNDLATVIESNEKLLLHQKYYKKLRNLAECYNREGKYMVDLITDRIAHLPSQQHNNNNNNNNNNSLGNVVVMEQEESSKRKDKRNNTRTQHIIGSYSDFAPKFPDQVFIGKSSHTTGKENTNAIDYLDQQSTHNCFYSKPLLQELKFALKTKHEEWKIREKIALVQSNMDESSDEEVIITEHDSVSLSSDEHDEQERFAKVEPTVKMSLVNEIARASERWGLKEECYIEDEV